MMEAIQLRDVKVYLDRPSKINNERQEILSQFVEAINTERIDTKFKPIQSRAVAIKLGHVKTKDLWSFYSQCKDYKAKKGSFSRCFFGALKINK